ncbi:TRAP transporter small permease subunit [Chloroflexota bacterium]
MNVLKQFFSTAEKVNIMVGNVIRFLIYPLIALIIYEVTMRYVFNSPPRWGLEVSSQIFLAYVILSGGYALLRNQHVSMDLLRNRLSFKSAAIVDLVTYLFLILFCIAIIWKGTEGAIASCKALEVTQLGRIPLYPVKVLVPVGGLLLLLQSVVCYARTILVVLNRKDS